MKDQNVVNDFDYPYERSSRGGGALLKKHGPDYFKKLRANQIEKQRKAMELYNKTHGIKKSKKKKGSK